MSHKKSVRRQNIKAIILAGSRDFGRCPLALRLPTALWPVASRPAIECLSRQGIMLAQNALYQVKLVSALSVITVQMLFSLHVTENWIPAFAGMTVGRNN